MQTHVQKGRGEQGHAEPRSQSAEAGTGASALQSTLNQSPRVQSLLQMQRMLNPEPVTPRTAATDEIIQANGLPGGLGNSGTDCFLNAVIQLVALGYGEMFSPGAKLWPEGEPRRAQDALWTVIRNVEAGRSVDQEEIVRLRTTMFQARIVPSTVGQEDAAEVLRLLLDRALNPESEVRFERERSFEPEAAHPITEQELGTDPSRYVKGKARQDESTRIIPVEVDRYDSFESFLFHQFGEGVEINYDEKNRPKVQSDGSPVALSRVREVRRFQQLPPVLTFNLLRFRIGATGERERIGRSFPMPERVVLVAENRGTEQWCTYELAGFVVQSGTLSGGHYWAHRKVGGTWVKLDDDKAPATDKTQEDLDKGYLYTYRRVAVSPTAPPGERIPQKNRPAPRDRPLDEDLLDFLGGTAPAAPTLEEETGQETDELRGLENRANDCFLIAAIQIAAGPLRPLFDPSRNPSRKKRDKVLGRIWQLANQVIQGGKTPVGKEAVASLRKVLAQEKIVEGEAGQEDASELLLKLINRAMRPEDRLSATRVRSFEEADILEGKPSEQVKSGGQTSQESSGLEDYEGRRAERAEPANAITVNIQSFNSLEGFLYSRYGVGEQIDYTKGNEPKVNAEGQQVRLSRVKEVRVLRALPPLLTFVLNRFQLGEGGSRQKIDKRFFMPEQLVLRQVGARDEVSWVRYRMTGVVVQRGSLSQGHYYSWVRGKKGWLKANDSRVTQHDSPGGEVDEGYIYTYEREEVLDKPPKGAVVANAPGSEHSQGLFGQDDLGLRLLFLMMNRQDAEATRLLDFPGVDVTRTAPKTGNTALHLAVSRRDAAMAKKLLRRGASPFIVNKEGLTPIELAQGTELLPLLRAYQFSDLAQIEPRAGALSQEKVPDKRAFQALYDQLNVITEGLREQMDSLNWAQEEDRPRLVALQRTASQLREVRQALNTAVAKALGVERRGAGGRPDAFKAREGAPKGYEVSKDAAIQAVLADLGKPAKGVFDAFVKFNQENTHQDIGKTIEEALSAAFARTQLPGTESIKPWSKKGTDFEYDVKGVPWDQKVLEVFEGSDYSVDRLNKTQTKGETKAVLLFDASYVDPVNYEKAWAAILQKALNGELEPSLLRETRAPKPQLLPSKEVLDTANATATPELWNVQKIENLHPTMEGGYPTVDSNQVAGLDKVILELARNNPHLIKSSKENGIALHQDHRGWLPPGRLYLEYLKLSGLSVAGAKTRLVISHDFSEIFLTCTHYKAFQFKDGATRGAQPIWRPPFYRILPGAELREELVKLFPPKQ